MSNINDSKDYEKCYGSNLFLEIGCDGSNYICCERVFFPGYYTMDMADDEYTAENIKVRIKEKREGVIKKVNESKLNSCSRFCKPHNNNRVLCKIDEKLKEDKENKTPLTKWLYGLHNYWIHWKPEEIDSKFKNKKPQIVAF